jgi:hypothetical protein
MQIGLQENIPRLRARRIREQYRFSPNPITGPDVYYLTLAETGDRDKAEKAEKAYMAHQLRAGRVPVI